MKKLLIITFLFLFFSNLSFAESNVFPFPKGKVYITNGYGGSSTHQGDYYYSLDFRAYDTVSRCDSYGAPVLAAKSGVVIKSINPIQNKLGEGYGVHTYIKNDDNSILRYAHMIDGSLAVKEGDSVRQGQILGLMGATGKTYGTECQAFNGINNGAHLHFEMRDKDNNAKNPEPLVGAENYTNMSIANSPYISATLMYDPNNHWAKYNGKVPYRLTYSPSAIHSFSPLIVQAGANQIFTIKGESLFDDLSVTLSGCKKIEWIKRDPDEQQFSCDMANVKGLMPGFIKFSLSGKPDFQFAVELVADKEGVNPVIIKADAVNPLAGKITDFIIEGKYLPADLEFDLNACKDLAYKKITPDYREFSCRLPHTIKGVNGKRINGYYTFNTSFSSESANFSHPIRFSADYEVRIDKMEPFIAASGIKTAFTFTGKNLNLVKAVWVEKCDNLREIERSDDKVTIECVPQSPDKLWYYFVPDFLRKDLYKIILKDEPGGTTLFESKIFIIPVNKTPEVTDENEEIMVDAVGGQYDDQWDKDKIIEYVLQANGDYSDEFLEYVGWRRLTENDYQEGIKGLELVDNDIRKMQNYEMISCPESIETIAVNNQIFDRSSKLTTYWLNTFGKCSNGFNTIILYIESDENFLKKIMDLSIPDNADLIYLKQRAEAKEITNEDINYLQENGLHIVDKSYKWFTPTHYTFVSKHSIPAFSKYRIEPKVCEITENEVNLIKKYLNANAKKLIKKIWESSYSNVLKFYMQNALDLAIVQAKELDSGLNNNKISCIGFWFEFLGLYSADSALELLINGHQDSDTEQLLKYYSIN